MRRCAYFYIYQYSETHVMHFLFSLLRIKGLYMFRALLAYPQETLYKRHLVLLHACYVIWLHQDWSVPFQLLVNWIRSASRWLRVLWCTVNKTLIFYIHVHVWSVFRTEPRVAHCLVGTDIIVYLFASLFIIYVLIYVFIYVCNDAVSSLVDTGQTIRFIHSFDRMFIHSLVSLTTGL
jgi:hypothetical protein